MQRARRFQHTLPIARRGGRVGEIGELPAPPEPIEIRVERGVAQPRRGTERHARALAHDIGIAPAERALGGRYAYVVRERAGVAFGAPARLRDAALDAYLDRLGRRGKFTDLANAAAAARDRQGVLEAARALHEWQWEKAT